MKHSTKLRRQLADLVLAAIQERRWTQTQAARFLDTTQSRISDLRRCERVSSEQLVDWLASLGRSVTVTSAPLPSEELTIVDERHRLLEEARTLLAEGKFAAASIQCTILESQYPDFLEVRAVQYEALTRSGLPHVASRYRPRVAGENAIHDMG